MKKKTKIIIAAIVLIVLAAAAVCAVCAYQDYYERTYIVIDEVEYRRDITTADLSGGKIIEFEKLKELTCLESLDLCGTGISIAQYDELQAALPNCSIHWSVPFQGGYCNSETTELDLDILTEEDLDALAYLPGLKSLKAETCRKYDVIMELIERYPDLSVSYTVEVGGKVYDATDDTLDVSNPSAEELIEKLAYMPLVTTVNLTGELPANEELLKVQQAYPDVTFVFDFEVFGVAVNTLDEFIDLSNIRIAGAEEVDAIIPHFYNLTQIDMVNCGIGNEDMDALNRRHQDIKIVWKVNVCGIYLRTDAKYFMPVQYKVPSANSAQCYNLRYCTDLQVIDLGHYGTSSVDFVEYLPNLKYLLLCEASVSDLTAIGNCISLEYIELQHTKVTDFWPLTNLSNLRDLNLSGVPCKISEGGGKSFGAFGDYTPLLQMAWLDRLWLPYNNLGSAAQTELNEALPNTVIIYRASGATTNGYRYTPRYFAQRDILGMYYGTN